MEKKVAFAISVAIIIVGAIIIIASIVGAVNEKKIEPISEEDFPPLDAGFEERFEAHQRAIDQIIANEEKKSSPPTIPWVPITTGAILIVVGIGGIAFLAKQSKDETLPK